MSNMINNTMRSVLPSIEGGVGGGSSFNWSKLLKVIIAVLTALAGSLGVVSCTKEEAPSNSPRGEDSIIAATIMHCQYENALISRDV